jgi:hypothetical protein
VHYQRDSELKQNKLTILPLVILLLFLISLLGDNIVLYLNFDAEAKTVLVANTVNCFFWTAVTLVTCFEWEIITVLVKFQSRCKIEEMGVLKSQFNQKNEGYLLKWQLTINILSLVYHGGQIAIIIGTTDT